MALARIGQSRWFALAGLLCVLGLSVPSVALGYGWTVDSVGFTFSRDGTGTVSNNRIYLGYRGSGSMASTANYDHADPVTIGATSVQDSFSWVERSAGHAPPYYLTVTERGRVWNAVYYPAAATSTAVSVVGTVPVSVVATVPVSTSGDDATARDVVVYGMGFLVCVGGAVASFKVVTG